MPLAGNDLAASANKRGDHARKHHSNITMLHVATDIESQPMSRAGHILTHLHLSMQVETSQNAQYLLDGLV